jgi:membrane-associated phospholipid phosphatase
MRWLIDWLPLPAILFAYQCSGWASRALGRPPADWLLLGWDLRIFRTVPGVWLQRHAPRLVLDGLELFYFSYYLFLPVAAGLLILRGSRRDVWRFWLAGGLSYLICDLISPWFPSTPPRLLWADFAAASLPRAMNLFILDRFSVGANVFPSSHVAGTLALALCGLGRGRWWLALWAAGIAVSTIAGGYHYGVDALAGIAVACMAAAAARGVSRPARSPLLEPRRPA